ncbi:MAG TPA: hypothetical protein VEK56_09095 [Vicinamibacterales bacterium]|nr:hypothetical protein [Vicinamibacterales bacterium]
MDVRNGFIVGIFNYCDRWCETCAFTSRCRLFADLAQQEASLDPIMRPVIDAPLLTQDLPPPPPKWMEDLIDEMNEAASKPLTAEELALFQPKILPEHKDIDERAKAYCVQVIQWLRSWRRGDARNAADPISVISWFASLNASKIHRALTGLAEDDGNREFPPDHEGSAKVALVGIDRSRMAWQQLVSNGRVDASAAAPYLAELEWLRERLDRAFPSARAFVRPGFDEPEAVAGLF